MRSANTIAAVSGLARSNAASIARAEDFDADLLLLGTPGGTVDLRSGLLQPPRREDMITKLTAVSPALPGTPAPHWQQFLNDVLDGDAEAPPDAVRYISYEDSSLPVPDDTNGSAR